MEDIHSMTTDMVDSLTKEDSNEETTAAGTPLMYAYQMACTILPPFILALGTVGNLLIIVVMCRMPPSTSTPYLPHQFITLAVSDLTTLYTGFLPDWLIVFDIRVDHLNAAVCKLRRMIMFTSGMISAWLLMAMALQRTVAVVVPHRASYLLSGRTGLVAIITVVVMSFLMHVHLLLSIALHQHPVYNTTICTISLVGNSSSIYWHVYPYMESVLLVILPSVVLVVCNVLLICKVNTSLRFSKMAVSSVMSSQRQGKAASLTVTLILTSTAFVLLTTPITVYTLYMTRNLHNYIAFMSPKRMDAAKLSHLITALIFYSNSAVNFYLYCLTGTRFRKELRKAFCGKQSSR